MLLKLIFSDNHELFRSLWKPCSSTVILSTSKQSLLL